MREINVAGGRLLFGFLGGQTRQTESATKKKKRVVAAAVVEVSFV